jgi:hypothetical protein
MKELFYSGVGSRECPPPIGQVMTRIATFLYEEGYILRSGGAGGADSYFEDGVVDPEGKHIYLPDKGFNKNPSPLYGVCEQALEIASKIHPAWHACRPYARLLHARNVYQVLGKDLNTPSRFLLCWTERGESKGGTRTAIKLAEKYDIPVLNFGSVRGDPMNAFDLFYMRAA